MPIYEYRCAACSHAFDALQKLSDEPLKECPACGQPQLRKLLSAPNFRLKGGGWYETDFKDKNRRNIAGETADGGSSKVEGDGKAVADASPAADKATGTEKLAAAAVPKATPPAMPKIAD